MSLFHIMQWICHVFFITDKKKIFKSNQMTEPIPETPETVQKNYLNDCVPLEQLLIPKYVSI